MTLLLAILFLIMAVGCRAISELALHGKLKWSKGYYTFWGGGSWVRKYKNNYTSRGQSVVNCEPSPTTYYYKLFNLKYKEKFPGSATIFSFVTDGMHLMQFAYHICLAGSISIFSGIDFLIIWPVMVIWHAVFYRIFSK